ncbi:unnamed protein product, partial [Symbiodinium pilosum]
RLRKKLYGLMRREKENFSETVLVARSMQEDLSSYLHNLTHQAWRRRKTHKHSTRSTRSTSNLQQTSADIAAGPDEASSTFPEYATELKTNSALRKRLAELESFFS